MTMLSSGPPEGGRSAGKSQEEACCTPRGFPFTSANLTFKKFMQYYVGKNGQQLGPFGEEQIKARVATGEFSTADLIWREGMASWEPISTVFNNPYCHQRCLGASPLLTAQTGQRLAGCGSPPGRGDFE